MPHPALPRPALLAALAVGALLLAGAARLADPALPVLLVISAALGAVFVLRDFGFAGGFRALLEDGDGSAVAATAIIPALLAPVIIPVAAFGEGYGRFVTPIGLPLVFGAMLFGIGMQITNGCGSGVLVAAGQGSRRMWVALPFFCLGGVLGSLILPHGLALPSLGQADLVAWLGPWRAVVVTEALLLVAVLALARGAPLPRGKLAAGAAIAVLAGLLFLTSGMPWGITTGLTLWGAKTVQALGVDLTHSAFWMMDWAGHALRDSPLANHSSLADAGLLAGALLAAAAQGALRFHRPLGWRGAAGAALGGLLMGVGARLSSGCNVGAFVGGAASGSLHGLVWLAAVIPGCWIGIRMRPWFGMARR